MWRLRAACAAGVLLLAGCGGGGKAASTTGSSSATSPAAAAPQARGPLDPPRRIGYGVTIDLALTRSVAADRQDVDDAVALHARTIRVAIQWAGMEPLQAGQYAQIYVKRLDALVAYARRRGVKVLLTPLFTPCWAAQLPAGVTQPCADPKLVPVLQVQHPRDVADYGRFAAFLARRYDGALSGIEVWNEPNLPSFWAAANAARDYARLLHAAHDAIEAAAPGTPVIGGAIAGADVGFLDALYAAGIDGAYDALSLHAYNDGRAPRTRVTGALVKQSFLPGLLSVRAALDAHGETKPVWLTEVGWNTSTQRGQAFNDGVTEAQQASYLATALSMLRTRASGVALATHVFVYRLRDPGANRADPQDNFGLIAADGTRKPSFATVQTAFARG